MARVKARGSQLFLPLSVLAILILINLIKGADYFSISSSTERCTGTSRTSCSAPRSW